MSEEVSVTETLVTRFRYDPNENLTLKIWPEGNAMSNRHDERDLLFQSTRGRTECYGRDAGSPIRAL